MKFFFVILITVGAMMEAWGAGQPSGARLAHLGIDARAAVVRDSLAALDAAADNVTAALMAAGQLLTFAEEGAGPVGELVSLVKSKVPIISSVVDSYATDLGRSILRATQQASQLTSLSKRLADVEARLAGSERRVLLGESAYSLDAAACIYVFRDDKYRRGTTIGQLQLRAGAGELTEVQHERWRRLCTFVRLKGWSISDALATGTMVKELRREGARATAERKAQVSLQQLTDWASSEFTGEGVGDCREFLQLVAAFGQGGSPLVIAGNVVGIVDNCLKENAT